VGGEKVMINKKELQFELDCFESNSDYMTTLSKKWLTGEIKSLTKSHIEAINKIETLEKELKLLNDLHYC
jgi:hypothetical protein